MKTRPLNKLYRLVLDNFDTINYGCYGICSIITAMKQRNIITYQEYLELIGDFRWRRPWIFSKFYWRPAYNKNEDMDAYWWKKNEEGNLQRKLWLEDRIRKFK